jgi:hypothetical protein
MWCYNEESEDLSSISLECTIDYRCFYEQDNKTFAVDTTGMCYTPREKISVNTLNLKDITKNITLGMKIKTGSYLGTGTAGAASPNILTFDFTPVLLIIAPESGNSSNIDTNEAIFFIGRKNYYRHW